MEAARERQQQQLAAAAEARLKAMGTKPEADNKPSSPTAPAAAEMPARMKAAMERRQAVERAEVRLQPPAPEAPAASTKKKETLLEKMERIEKGKGSADFNPLHGKTQTGGQGLSQRKKGG